MTATDGYTKKSVQIAPMDGRNDTSTIIDIIIPVPGIQRSPRILRKVTDLVGIPGT
jgi:hypothetical protein